VACLDLTELVSEKEANIFVWLKIIIKLKMGERCLLGSKCDDQLNVRLWTTHYQELEWKLVSGHGGREELYQVGLGVFVQASIKAVYDDHSAKFLRKIITLACEELKGFKDKLCELHLNGICKDEGISLSSVYDELVGAGNDTSNTVGANV